MAADVTAAAYADRFHRHLDDKPLDRAMLSGFAGLVGADGDVADVGCGTGATTAILTEAGALAGVCAWYSIIHVPDEQLPQVFSEFGRMLRTGGHILLAFGEPVFLTFYRRRPEAVAGLMHEAGLDLYAQLVREPDADGLESTPQENAR